jgi:hypothetical protein
MNIFRRTIHSEVRVLDAKTGTVEYVASDETLDSYREVIRASGWRFDQFKKNAPFVDSHNYHSVDKLLGKVTSFEVRGKQLVETVQWAIDVATNTLAQLGWKMTEAGYLKAVSVGFFPTKWVSKWDTDPSAYQQQLMELKLDAQTGPRVVYLEQQQVELSACIIGANPNALAKSYKAGLLTDADLDMISAEQRKHETASEAIDPGLAELARVRAREQLADAVMKLVAKL